MRSTCASYYAQIDSNKKKMKHGPTNLVSCPLGTDLVAATHLNCFSVFKYAWALIRDCANPCSSSIVEIEPGMDVWMNGWISMLDLQLTLLEEMLSPDTESCQSHNSNASHSGSGCDIPKTLNSAHITTSCARAEPWRYSTAQPQGLGR